MYLTTYVQTCHHVLLDLDFLFESNLQEILRTRIWKEIKIHIKKLSLFKIYETFLPCNHSYHTKKWNNQKTTFITFCIFLVLHKAIKSFIINEYNFIDHFYKHPFNFEYLYVTNLHFCIVYEFESNSNSFEFRTALVLTLCYTLYRKNYVFVKYR